MAKNAKVLGGTYEREFSYKLSEWITGEAGTSICWRDKSSGGRHTIRGKQGLQTSGSGGDIYPTDSRYEYWFAKFYIDTKNYPDVNWVFGNPANQRSNDILKQWIKTLTQCPRDKMPMMPCKIRNRVTPEFIVFPKEARFSSTWNMVQEFTTVEEIKVDLSKKEQITVPKGEPVRFQIALTADFFHSNEYEFFYQSNKDFIHNKNHAYDGNLRLF